MEKLPKISEQERLGNVKRVERARMAFEDTLPTREERQRTFRYYTGDQWGDIMKDPQTGQMITEEAFIKKQGRLPAKQNLMGKTIRSIVGQFRTNYPDPVAFGRTRGRAQAGEMMTSALQYALDINEANELDARNMEEFAVGGAAGWKIGYKWWNDLGREDIYMANLDTTRLFYNVDSTDIRGHDLRFIGEIHDMTMDEIINRFGLKYRDIDKLKKLFPDHNETNWDIWNIPQYIKKYRDFYIPDNPDKHRVIEMWEKEYEDQQFLHDTKDGTFERIDKQFFIDNGYPQELLDEYSMDEFVDLLNEARIAEAEMQGVDPSAVPVFKLHERYEEITRVYFLTPYGELIMKMDSPYEHGSWPYVFGRYMMDGKVMSLGHSVIDQQKHVNRLISMMDAALGRSLKQVMMIDENSVPDSYKGDFQAYADDMAKANGMVFYTSRNGQINMPKEITQNSVPADAINLLNLQSELLKDISAVTDAVQGKAPGSGTPASLYAQQTLNASVTNKDIFDFYFGLIRKRNRMIVQVIKQFYDEPRHIKISGTGFSSGVESTYDPREIEDIDFDVVIGESQNTLAYRQTVDTELKEFLGAQMITFEEYLKTTSMPYADKLLQTIANRKEAEGGEGQQMTEEQMMQQMQQQSAQQ